MQPRRKFLFLYLNTGAGHISTAKVLKESILKLNPNAEILMVHGFDKSNLVGKFFFESGYYLATNFVQGAYPLTYDLSNNRFMTKVMAKMLRPNTVRHLLKVIEKENPTDIVSFHFALTSAVKSAIIRSHKNISLKVMVTDPFTAHKAWFLERDQKYLVYSKQIKDFAIKQKIPEKNIQIVPFVMNPKYRVPFTKDDINSLRKKYGFEENKKVLLMVGGGDGIPGALEIINKCILRRANFAVAVVCGRDAVKQTSLEILRTTHPKLDLHVFGFVDYLDELVKLSDCVVMKAGPATLLEVLSCRKPVIICRYIHNQELGNMRFAVDNKVGYFIQSPGKIYDKVEELLNDTNFNTRMASNFDKLKIDTDTDKVAEILLG